MYRVGGQEIGKFQPGHTNNILITSVTMVYDHWARASSSLRTLLTHPDTCHNISIETVDGNKTVIRMTGDNKDTNTNFRSLQDSLEWVQTKLVSSLTLLTDLVLKTFHRNH